MFFRKHEEKLDKYLKQVKIKLKAKDNKDWVWLENIYYRLNNWEYIKYTKQIKIKNPWIYILKNTIFIKLKKLLTI